MSKLLVVAIPWSVLRGAKRKDRSVPTGASSQQVTTEIYTHIFPEEFEGLREKLDAIYSEILDDDCTSPAANRDAPARHRGRAKPVLESKRSLFRVPIPRRIEHDVKIKIFECGVLKQPEIGIRSLVPQENSGFSDNRVQGKLFRDAGKRVPLGLSKFPSHGGGCHQELLGKLRGVPPLIAAG